MLEKERERERASCEAMLAAKPAAALAKQQPGVAHGTCCETVRVIQQIRFVDPIPDTDSRSDSIRFDLLLTHLQFK